MNALSSSTRRWPMQRSLFNHLQGAFLVLCTFFAAAAPKAKADYTFTLIADSAGAFSNFGSGSSPSLNSSGTVAFYAALDNGRYGIFTGSGGATTTIALNPQLRGGYGFPSINQAGIVAFYEQQGNFAIERILAGNGGPLTVIADTAGQFRDFAYGYITSINSAGTVTFSAFLDSGPGGIFSGNGGEVTPLFVNSPSFGTDSSFTVNEAGTLAARSGNGNRVVTFNSGAVTTIADDSGSLNYFSTTPSINSTGTVAFVAGMGGIDGGAYGIYSGNGGPLTTIADLSGPFSSFGLFTQTPSINRAGTVAFIAGLDIGGASIFVGDGTATSEVIGIGDALFGSTVATFNISPTSLNDDGQLAFYYRLANGTTGIALATPVPEPSAALLLTALFGVGLLRRFR